MSTTPEDPDPPARERRNDFVFRPGAMPPLFGDTAAALIVDDDEAIERVLARLLEREGYHCTLAANAAEARARLAEREFAIALVDVMMPGESGLELVADLLADHPDLAVVMVTGVDDPSIAELALESGAYGYVVKPFQPNHVLITVANAGRRRCLEIERRLYERRLEQRSERASAAGAAGPDAPPAVASTAPAGTAASDATLAALQRVVHGVAHDLNNVLTTITSLASLAGDGHPEDSRLHTDLADIASAAAQAAHLTRQLLDLVGPEGPTVVLDGLEARPSAPERTGPRQG